MLSSSRTMRSVFKTKRCVVLFTGESCVQEKDFWVDLSQEGEAVNGFFRTQALGVETHGASTP